MTYAMKPGGGSSAHREDEDSRTLSRRVPTYQQTSAAESQSHSSSSYSPTGSSDEHESGSPGKSSSSGEPSPRDKKNHRIITVGSLRADAGRIERMFFNSSQIGSEGIFRNGEDLSAPRLRVINDGEAEVTHLLTGYLPTDLERQELPALNKKLLLRQWHEGLLAKNKATISQQFLEWIDELNRDPSFERATLLSWIMPFVRQHAKLLGENFVEHVEQLMHDYSELWHITVKSWLDSLGIESEEEKGKEKGKELKKLEAFPSSDIQREFYEIVRYTLFYVFATGLEQHELDQMDPRVKAFLAYFQRYGVQEQLTYLQWALGGLGIITAIGNGFGQGTIFDSSIPQLSNKFGLEFLDTYRAERVVLVFTAFTAFLDSFPRDWEEFTKAWPASKKKFTPHTSKVGWLVSASKSGALTFMAFPASALAFYYFFAPEYGGIEWLRAHPNYPDQDSLMKQTWAYFGCIAPWVLLEAIVGTRSQLREVNEALGKKKRILTSHLTTAHPALLEVSLLGHVLKQRPLSDAEVQQDEFVDTLKKMRKAVFYMTDAEVSGFYRDVFKTIFKDKTKNPEDIETLNAQDAFFSIAYLMRYLQSATAEDQEEKPACVSKTWKQRLGTTVGLFTAGAASFARYLTYRLVMLAFLEAMGVGNVKVLFATMGLDVSEDMILGVCSNFCGFFGWLIQGFVEEMAVEENVNTLLISKVHSRSSHSWIRKGIKGVSAGFGLYNTVPYLVTGLQAMQGYSTPLQVAALAPYILADSHSTAWQLGGVDGTYGAYVHMYDRVRTKILGERLGGPSKAYKRDRIVKWFTRLIDLSREADPEVIKGLNVMLEAFHETITAGDNATDESSNDDTPTSSSQTSDHIPVSREDSGGRRSSGSSPDKKGLGETLISNTLVGSLRGTEMQQFISAEERAADIVAEEE